MTDSTLTTLAKLNDEALAKLAADACFDHNLRDIPSHRHATLRRLRERIEGGRYMHRVKLQAACERMIDSLR